MNHELSRAYLDRPARNGIFEQSVVSEGDDDGPSPDEVAVPSPS